MTPAWIRDNAKPQHITKDGNDVRLTIPSDTRQYENIFKVELLPKDILDKREDITVRMLIGAEVPNPTGSMAFMVSDGDEDWAVGIQLRDPKQDYTVQGPYIGLEGRPGFVLTNVDDGSAQLIKTKSTNYPDQFEMVIKPSERWGSAFCPIDDGHKICGLYARTLNLNSGIFLDVYRDQPEEVYVLNYIEVWIYKDSPKDVDPVKLRRALKAA